MQKYIIKIGLSVRNHEDHESILTKISGSDSQLFIELFKTFLIFYLLFGLI